MLSIKRFLVLIMALIVFGVRASAQSGGRTFYIDFMSGSNANPGTQASPWKSHPYMQTASACTGTGSAPAYAHQAGDQFIFKGGVTWPAACFQMTLQAGGTSSAQDYYGANTGWFAGASFARPIFDLAQTVPTPEPGGYHHNVIFANGNSYLTIDSLEIKNQAISNSGVYATTEGIQFYGTSGDIVEGVYLHDWMTNSTISNTSNFTPDYDAGAIFGPITLRKSPVTGLTNIISDANGFGFNSTGNKVAVGMGGACMNCSEVSDTLFSATQAACFTVSRCHDNEMTGIAQTAWDAAIPGGFGLDTTHRPHTQVIEDDSGSLHPQVWCNNYIHDNPTAGVTIYGSDYASIFNNVMVNNANGNILLSGVNNSASDVGYVLNNIVDCSNGSACFASDGKATIPGTVNLKNNIWITNGTPIYAGSPFANLVQANNYTMPTSEASTYGFTSARKYSPSSSDSNVTGKGANLSSLATGNLTALAQDVEGASWYGGSYVARPTVAAWDLGAYQSGGTTTPPDTTPPTVAITAPANGATVSGTITVSGTAADNVAVANVQVWLDGGAYSTATGTTNWTFIVNTSSLTNASHTISAKATDTSGNVSTAASATVTVNNVSSGSRVFYIDFTSGSNANPGTQASPWKSHPYMQTGSGCVGTTGTSFGGYAHQAGDQFIFKGGVSWPAACFGLIIPAGGTATAIDYYGVDKTWFSGAVFTRPKFDLAQQYPASGNHIIATVGASGSGGVNGGGIPGIPYLTFDNLEIANPLMHIVNVGTNVDATAIMVFGGQHALQMATGVTVKNCYLHDWATTDNLTSTAGFGYGALFGASLVDNVEMSDANGYAYVNGLQTPGTQGNGCLGCGELRNSKIHDGWVGCSSCGDVHDNEFYNINQNYFAGLGGVHTHIIYQDGGSTTNISLDPHDTFAIYNNYIHDNTAALIISACYNSAVYNNIVSNSAGNMSIELDPCNDDSASAVGYVANNFLDPGNNVYNEGCFRSASGTAGLGTLYVYNNICMPTSGSLGGFNVNTQHTGPTGGAYIMSPSEASTYGFTATRKFAPSASDPNVVGTGTNPSSLGLSCSGNLLQWCSDTEGAPWYGGNYTARPTGSTAWTLGAYAWPLGTGSASISVSPATIDFGSVTVGSTSTVMFSTLTNTGNATLTFNGDAISGDFIFGGLGNCNNPGGTLAPGASCRYSAKFTPTATGTRAGAITITDTATNSPQTIQLTGVGAAAFSPCDVNKDGTTNVVDAQLDINAALGVLACAPTYDINQDGLCNVIDVQRVINAVLGGQCVVGP